MATEHRDRAAGWKHAKLSGHSNEECVKNLLDTDPAYGEELLRRMGYPSEKIKSTSIGGLHETNVPSVLGRTTKSKTDLKIFCESGRTINVSIKKSLSGQVYFVRAKLFMQVFEKQFHKEIPAAVKRAIELFWAAADDATEIIEQFGNKAETKNYEMQLRHKSLNATTLKNYDPSLYAELLQWFNENAYELTKLSFTMGAAADKSEWSEFVWYINLLGENDVDEVFRIEDICQASADKADSLTFYGTKNGGTTIQLPFGIVQWHLKQLQFRHSYDSISMLLSR